MRRQQREPGTELAPLEYVLALQQAEREARERMPLPTAGVEPVMGQEVGYDHV